MRKRGAQYILVPAALVIFSITAQAQATRTWVSGVGDDVNPCSRTAPCKTWAGAISKTASGGEINALDPGGYGTLTITKAITIDGSSQHASTLNSGGISGFTINITTLPKGPVVIRNVAINGTGTTLGTNGVRFLSGDSLVLENVFIHNQSTTGVDFQPNSAAKLSMRNVTITRSGVGVQIKPSTVAAVAGRASISNCTITNNTTGVRAEDFARVTIADSTVSNNSGDGVLAFSALGSGTILFHSRNEISGNGTGLRSTGGNAIQRVANSTITTNVTGLATTGELSTCGNNQLNANDANGAFSGATVACNF